MTRINGRGWAYLGVTLGAAASVAANVAHSYVPPGGVPAGWTPPAGAVIGAVFWPTALLVAIEVMARVDWPAGPWWIVLRFGGLLPVAAVAGLVSYRHMSGLLTYYRDDPLTATLGPLAVDGLMLMMAAALIATAPRAAVPVPGSITAGGQPAVPAVPAATVVVAEAVLDGLATTPPLPVPAAPAAARGTGTKPRPRTGTAAPAKVPARVRDYWRTSCEEGRQPTGTDLARAGRVTDSLGRRYRRTLLAEDAGNVTALPQREGQG